MEDIYKKVKEECDKQDEKWGVRSQHPLVWLAILTEEVGEVAKEICDSDFSTGSLSENYEKELVQCGAVIFQMIKDLKNY